MLQAWLCHDYFHKTNNKSWSIIKIKVNNRYSTQMKLAFLSIPLANAIFMFLVLAPACAYAACSRTIHIPVAPIGYSIILNGDAISGIYADLLREVKKTDVS